MTPLLYILLSLSLAGGVLIKISPIPTVNIYLFDVFSVLIVIFSYKEIVSFLRSNVKNLIPVYIFIVVGGVGVLGGLGELGVLGFISSISYMGRLILYLLLTIPLLTLPKTQLGRFKKWMLYSGFLFVGLGYLQYAYYPSLRNLYYLGWDEHLYRLFSTFLDPNFAGIFIVLIIFLYTSFFLNVARKVRTSRQVLFLGGYMFLLPALFLTYSRSSIIVFIVSSVILLFLLKKTRYILVLVALVIIGIIAIPKNLAGEGVNLMRTASAVSRFQYSERALQIFLDQPIVGVGYNTLRFTSERYGFVKGAGVLQSHAAAGVPNSYLVILATTGIVGFLAAGYFLLRVIWGIRVNKGEQYFTIVVMVSLVGVLFGSLFENLLFYAPIMIWLILITGILFGLKDIKGGT